MRQIYSHVRTVATAPMALSLALALTCGARADEYQLSSFEGDLSTPLGVDWTLGSFAPGAWTDDFVPTQASDGTLALQIFHNTNQWEPGLVLSTPQLIDLVSSYDTLEFDVSPSLDTGYRQVFAVMQGDGLSWAQTPEFNLAIGNGVDPSNHVSINLSSPNPSDPSKNWKAAAQSSPGTWWQLLIGLQGNDWTGASTISTTIDNVKFVRNSGGDFDADGDVDGRDFLTWQQGQSPTPLSATDLADWKANYGAGGGALALNAVGVPEPSSVGMLLVAIGAMAWRRKWK